MTRARISILLLACLSLLSFPSIGRAQVPMTMHLESGEVSVVADQFETVGSDNLLVATGNVEVTRGPARLLADRVELNRATGDAVASGRVTFYDGDERLTGKRMDFNIKTGTGVIYEGEAHAPPYYRVAGERIERLGDSVYRVQKGVFTTCEDDSPSWSFHMGTANADMEDWVWGTNASFWVKAIPIIPFFPIFAAPLRKDRQSGFLTPVFGSSSRKGAFGEVPFYWVISDSMDATISAGFYSKLGFGGSAEYRYVLSQDQKGSIGGALVYESFKNGAVRGYGSAKQEWRLMPGLSVTADLNGVTDDHVLRDYASDLHRRSAQRAESNFFVTKTWTNWNLVGRVYWYQDLTVERPVELQRVPEITLQGVRQTLPGLPGFLYQVDSSAVNFLRWQGSDGARLDVHPVVSRPIPLAGYLTVTPFVGGRTTAYSTTVTGNHVPVSGPPPVEDTNGEWRVRELLEYGSDAESRAARVYPLDGFAGFSALLHSIEPRAHYIRIVGHNFYGLPQWTNIDLIPEANWFEYSLTNRLRARTVSSEESEATRLDLVRLVVANAYDYQAGRFGNVAGDLTLQPTTMLGFHADASYNINGQGLQAYTADVTATVPRVTGVVGLRYNRAPAVQIPYFVQVPGTFSTGANVPDASAIHFLQGSVSVEIWRNLVLRVQTNWDLRTDTFVESRFGLDFKFDCWAFSTEYVKRTKDIATGQKADDEIRFSLHLLGLGNVVNTKMGASVIDSGPSFK
jgi:LPS-assembly protein